MIMMTMTMMMTTLMIMMIQARPMRRPPSIDHRITWLTLLIPDFPSYCSMLVTWFGSEDVAIVSCFVIAVFFFFFNYESTDGIDRLRC